MDKIETKRLKYQHQGRTVYEWEQTLEEVHVYIDVPEGVRSKMLDVSITASQLRIGLRGNPPFIDEPFQETVNSTDSLWTLEDGVLHLSLTKGSKGVTWACLLQGHTVNDPLTASEVQKSLMLERFQAEVRACQRTRRRDALEGACHRHRSLTLCPACVAEPWLRLLGRDLQRQCAGPEVVHGWRGV